MEHSKIAAARITQALNYAYEKGEIPKKWQLSETAQLNKSNGKEGTKAVRLINLLCPMGKMFYKRVWGTAEERKYDARRT